MKNYMPNGDKLDSNIDIENAIELLAGEKTNENLAYALSVIRRVMNSRGEMLVAVDANPISNKLAMKTISTVDGREWFFVFTSYDEQLKGNKKVVSGFASEITKIFDLTMATEDIAGVVINPWGKTLVLDKDLIKVILG